MSQYFYATDVFSCIVDDTAIFLNLNTDQYLGLDGDRSRLFRRMVDDVHDADTERLAEELVAKGLLTRSSALGRPLAPSHVDLPKNPLLEPIYEETPKVSAGEFAAFVRACTAVHVSLRHRGTHQALRRFARSQARIRHSAQPFDLTRVRDLVRVFCHLRPIVYGAFDNCLYDSLVLGDFLQRHRVVSNCVLGVRTMPFEAHCWLQTNGFAANGIPEMIKRFVPILVV